VVRHSKEHLALARADEGASAQPWIVAVRGLKEEDPAWTQLHLGDGYLSLYP
jgi:hypothetical protein